MFIIPIYFQVTNNASTGEAGAYLIPSVIGNTIGGLLTGAWIKRYGRSFTSLERRANVMQDRELQSSYDISERQLGLVFHSLASLLARAHHCLGVPLDIPRRSCNRHGSFGRLRWIDIRSGGGRGGYCWLRAVPEWQRRRCYGRQRGCCSLSNRFADGLESCPGGKK